MGAGADPLSCMRHAALFRAVDIADWLSLYALACLKGFFVNGRLLWKVSHIVRLQELRERLKAITD